MILINTVYQKVLAFANKEQRGYITPQEFNLFADQAQKEIFEQYFYDLDQAYRSPGRQEEYSDTAEHINNKIAFFEKTSSGVNLPEDLYRLGVVFSNSGLGYNREVEQVSQREYFERFRSYLTKPTVHNKVYLRASATKIAVYPSGTPNYWYTRKPGKPSWAYVVVNERAMYDSSNTINFELHSSEESELVYRILAFAGISMQKPNLVQAAIGMETTKQQQEKQ
tara:strand:+ start:36 stop:707 length:672 start_codon:yes stop_codon:yes gene_type:complete